MLNHITQESLNFLEEAKEAFNKNYKMITYRNEADSFIALRNGFNESIIDIYSISEPVGRFTDQLPSQYTETVYSDELGKLKEASEILKNLKTVTDHYYDKFGDNPIILEILATYYQQLNKIKK